MPGRLLGGWVKMRTRRAPYWAMSKPISSTAPAPNFSGGAPQVKMVSSVGSAPVAAAIAGSHLPGALGRRQLMRALGPPAPYADYLFTVTCAPVASVTRAAPNSWPAVHAPGLTPARTRLVVSAAMAAVARTPSPRRSSAVTVCPSGPVTPAQGQEPVPPPGALGVAVYAPPL